MLTGLLLALWLAASGPAFPCELLADLPSPTDPHGTAELNLSTGLFTLHFDRDGDGRPDLAMVFHVLATSDSLSDEPPWIELATVPVFLYLDRNQDGRWDEMWVNREGGGTCRTWELYSVIRPG